MAQTKLSFDQIKGVVVSGQSDTDFAAAIVAAAGKTLVIDSEITVTNTHTIPSTVSLVFHKGGLLSVSSGKTVTINSSLFAGRYEIFDKDAAGTIIIGDSACSAVYPEWWGAVADDSTDCAPAITKAHNAHSKISFLPGIYKVSAMSLGGHGRHWIGAAGLRASYSGAKETTIKAIGSQTHVLDINGHHHKFEYIYFDGGLATTNAIVNLSIPSLFVRFRNCSFYDTLVTTGYHVKNDSTNGGTTGTLQGDSCSWDECVFGQSSGLAAGNLYIIGSNAFLCTARKCLFQTANSGVKVYGGGVNVIESQFSGDLTYDVAIIGNSQAVNIEKCYTETANHTFLYMVDHAGLGSGSIKIQDCILNAENLAFTLIPANKISFINNNFGVGAAITIGSSPVGSLFKVLSVGNTFAGTSPFTGANSEKVIRFGDVEDYDGTLTERNFSLGAANYTFKDMLFSNFIWNPASIADGAGLSSSPQTVTGAVLGSIVLVSAPYDLQGLICTGYVSATNTVVIRLQNNTGGAIDLASGTWNIRVINQHL